MAVGSFPMNMSISLSKEKQLMEDDDKLGKEQLLEMESSPMALTNNILLEIDVELNKRHKGLLEIHNGLKDLKERHSPWNSGPSLERATSDEMPVSVAHNHTIKVSATEEVEGSDFSNTTMDENPDNGVVSVTVEIGDDQNPDEMPRSGGNLGEPDTIYWIRLHGIVLKISGGGFVKLCLSDAVSRQSFTYRVIAVMDGVVFVTSFVGNTAGDKYPNLSKVLGLVGAPAAIFMVIASLTEYAYPEHTILIPAIASLPPLLALADRAFGFNKSLPPFLALYEEGIHFQHVSAPSSRSYEEGIRSQRISAHFSRSYEEGSWFQCVYSLPCVKIEGLCNSCL